MAVARFVALAPKSAPFPVSCELQDMATNVEPANSKQT